MKSIEEGNWIESVKSQTNLSWREGTLKCQTIKGGLVK